MLSDNYKQKSEKIKEGLKSIESNINNLSFVYKIASNLFRISDSLEDNNLKYKIKGELAKITQTQYTGEIQQAIKIILTLISEAENIKQEKRYFEGTIIRATEDYKKDRERYSTYKKKYS